MNSTYTAHIKHTLQYGCVALITDTSAALNKPWYNTRLHKLVTGAVKSTALARIQNVHYLTITTGPNPKGLQ
jgi:hypothetical protein